MPKYNNEITDISRRGLWVVVRCFGDEVRRVRIWEENENAVWVVSDERYRKKLELGDAIPGPYVGFRWGNVFVDNPEWVDNWDPSFEGFWEGLTPLARVPSTPHPQESVSNIGVAGNIAERQ